MGNRRNDSFEKDIRDLFEEVLGYLKEWRIDVMEDRSSMEEDEIKEHVEREIMPYREKLDAIFNDPDLIDGFYIGEGT